MPRRLAKNVWCTKSQSSLLNIYFRLSIPVLTAIYSLPLHSEYLFTLNQSVALVWHRTYPICDAPLSRSARRSFALLQKSRRNHRPDVWTEALSGMVFVPARTLPGIRELKQQRRWRLQKRHLKSEFALPQTLSRLFHLVYFVKCWQMFLKLNSKGLY